MEKSPAIRASRVGTNMLYPRCYLSITHRQIARLAPCFIASRNKNVEIILTKITDHKVVFILGSRKSLTASKLRVGKQTFRLFCTKGQT
jgi:hypothetical protein